MNICYSYSLCVEYGDCWIFNMLIPAGILCFHYLWILFELYDNEHWEWYIRMEVPLHMCIDFIFGFIRFFEWHCEGLLTGPYHKSLKVKHHICFTFVPFQFWPHPKWNIDSFAIRWIVQRQPLKQSWTDLLVSLQFYRHVPKELRDLAHKNKYQWMEPPGGEGQGRGTSPKREI